MRKLIAKCLLVLLVTGAASARAENLVPQADLKSNPAMKGWQFEQNWMKSKFSKQSEGDAGFVRVSQPPAVARLTFDVPEGAKSLTFVVDARATDIEKGKEAWDIPMVQLALHKEGDNKPLNKPWPTNVKFGESTDGWVQRQSKVAIPEGATKATLTLSYKAKSGNFDLRQVAVYDTEKVPAEAAKAE